MRTRFLSVAAGVLAASVMAVPVLASASPNAVLEAGPPAAVLNHPMRALAQRAVVMQWLRAVALDQYLKAVAASAQVRRGGGHGCAPGDFECFKACTTNRESHATYGAVSSSGQYRGAYQFNQGLWDGQATASGRPDLVGVSPDQASPADQDQIAHDTYVRRGKADWGGRC
jgi:hypothetical protein